VYNNRRYFIKLGVSEDFYRFYRDMNMAERLEFNRRFTELLREKLRKARVQI